MFLIILHYQFRRYQEFYENQSRSRLIILEGGKIRLL